MDNNWSIERIRAFEASNFAETKGAFEHASAAVYLAAMLGPGIMTYPENSSMFREWIGSSAICLITFSSRVNTTPVWDEAESGATTAKEAYAALLANLAVIVQHAVDLDTGNPIPKAVTDKTVTALHLACCHLDKLALFFGSDLQTAINNVMTANAGEFED